MAGLTNAEKVAAIAAGKNPSANNNTTKLPEKKTTGSTTRRNTTTAPASTGSAPVTNADKVASIAAGTNPSAGITTAAGSPLNQSRDAQVRQAWASRPATERFAPTTSVSGQTKKVPQATVTQRLSALGSRISQNEQQLTNMGLQMNRLQTAYNRGDYSVVDQYNALADRYNKAFNTYVSDVEEYNQLYRSTYRDQGMRDSYARRQYMEQRQAARDQGSRQLYQQRLQEEALRAPITTTTGKENERVVTREPNRFERVVGAGLSGTASGFTTAGGLVLQDQFNEHDSRTLRRKGASVGEHSYKRISGEEPREAGYTYSVTPEFRQRMARAKLTADGLIDTGRRLNNRSTLQTEIAKEGLGETGQMLVDLGVMAVQMAADIGIAAATGGSMLVPLGIRSYGNGYLTAEQMGYTGDAAKSYALGVAAVEVLSEKMFSVFGIVNKYAKGVITQELSERVIDGLVKKLATSTGGRTALNRLFTILFSAGSEGLEEVVAGVLEPLIRKCTLDPSVKAWKEIDWQETLYEGLLGGILGGLGGAVDLKNTRPTYWKYYKEGIDEGIQRYEAAVKKYGLESQEAMAAAKDVWSSGNKKMNQVAGFIVGANEDGTGGKWVPLNEATTEDFNSGLPVTLHQYLADAEAARYGRRNEKGEAVMGPQISDSLYLGKYLQQEENARKEAENQRIEAARTIDQAQPGQGGEFPGSTNGISPSSPQGELTETSRAGASNEGETVRLDTARSAQTRAQAPQGVAESLSGIPEEEMTQEEKDELQYGSGAVENLGQYTGLAQRMGQPLAREGQGGEFSAAQKTSQGANVAAGTQKVDNMMARLQRQGALKGFNRADEIENKAKGVFHVNSVSIEILRELTGLPEEVANAAHEAGHLARYYDPELLQDVLDLMRSRGTDIDALVARKALQYQQRFEKAGVKWDPEEYDRDYFEEEVMAEFIGNICKADARYLDMIAAEKPSLLRRLINFFRRLVYEATGDQRAVFEKTIERMNAALEKAGEAKGGGGDRYTFGGENAVNADLDALGRAVDMDAAGTEMRDIFRETGWFKGADGKWRFEIDDSKMKYRHQGDLNYMRDPEYREYVDLWDKVVASFDVPEEEELERFYELDRRYKNVVPQAVYRVTEGGAVLSDIIEHEELFENYPQLRNAPIRFDKLPQGDKGNYNPITNELTLNRSLRDAPEDTLVHEIQHALQSIEGFSEGASPEYWKRNAPAGEERSAYQLYQNTAGEIEARDVTARRKMSEEQRRNTMPDTGNEDTVFAEGAEEAGSIINIEGEKGDYGRGVLLDTKMFDPHSPHIWGRVLQDYMYHIMAGKKLTMYDADGNPETVMIARANDRVRADGAKSDRKVLDKLARTTGDNIRTLAIIQLPELAEASGNETYSDKSTHKWLDEHGWRYRTVYLQDRDGNIYTAVLNIADGRDRLILYDVNNIRKIDKAKTPPAGVVSSAVSGGTRTEPSDVFKESIAPEETDVKPGDSSRDFFVDEALAMRKVMQELSAQVSRLTDRLDGKTPDSVGRQGAPGPVADQAAVAEPEKSTQYNSTVVLEESTVDKYLADYAVESSPNYAKAYITMMSPDDFLALTTKKSRRWVIDETTKPLDTEELADATRHQPFQLRINTETGEVIGHEGRHRMNALRAEGIWNVPVLLFDSNNKYSKEAMDSLTLHGQDFGDTRSDASRTVEDVLPLSYANRDQIIERFATQPKVEEIAERYGRSTVRYSFGSDLEDVGVTYDAETESVAPDDRFNLTTWNGSEYVQDAAKAAKELSQALGISEKKARKYIDDINSVAKMIADDKARLDFDAAEGLSSFVSNAEYGGSFDFSTLCKKRRLFTGTFTAIQSKLKNTALTPIDVLNLRKMMKDAGLEVPCGLCYVEGSRASMGKFSQEFIRLYEKYNPDAEWVPTMKDVNTPDGVETMRTEHPDVYKEYERFWNNHGKLRPGDPNLFASQQKPKLYMARSAYNGEVLKNFSKGDKVIDKNENGGLRIQSFSDFEIANMLDMMQVLMDMSRVGLAGQAYTKVPEFARAFGATGLKINLSLIAKDVDADGKLIFDDVEGMPFATAMEIRSQYSKNVGTILVVFDDAQLKAAMADERIDFIIPFHRSQWKKEQYEALGLPATTKDYTDQQGEKWFEKRYHESSKEPGKMVETKITPIMSKTYWDYSKTGKENAEEYLRLCKEDGRRPVFYKLLVDNGDGSYSLQPDGSTDGYWKTLIDFKMYDNEGNGAPQLPVRPDFSMDEITRILNEYEGGHNSFPVADKIVGKFVREYKKEHKGDRFSFGEDSFMDREYMAAVEAGDMDRTQQLVNQAAEIQMQESQARREDGKLLPVYHGTKADFNKFGREFIGSTGRMEGSGFNFTPSRDRAASYGGNVLRGFLNIEHPLSAEKKTMSVRELADIIRKIDPTGDNIIANYARDTRDYGSDSFIRRESLVTARAIHDYSDNDVDIYSELSAVNPDSDSLIEYFSQAGYDGLIHYDDSGKIKTLIAFNSNQFKRSDPITYDDDGNVIPLSERFNTKEDDMRFSFGEEEEGAEAEAPKDLGSMEPSERSKELIAAAAAAKRIGKQTERILRKIDLTEKEQGLVNALLSGALTVDELPRGINRRAVIQAYEAKKAVKDAAAPVEEYNKRHRELLNEEARDACQNSADWKNKKFELGMEAETPRRIFYGLTKDEAEAEKLTHIYVDPIREHNAMKVRMMERYGKQIEALHIDKKKRHGNKVSEDYAVQYVGELEFIIDWLEDLPEGETRGGVTYDEAKSLLYEFWKENPNLDKDHIRKAVAEFHRIYDEVFAMWNEARVLNGYAPVDYRKGYFPHFTSRSMDTIVQAMTRGMGFGVEVAELPTDIAGLTHMFKPGTQWSGHALERTGNKTDYSALEGWDRYIETVGNIIYHTDDIQRWRALERALRYKHGTPGVRDEMDKIRKNKDLTEAEREAEFDKLLGKEGKPDVTHLSAFVRWLNEYTNFLAGKRHLSDRIVEDKLSREWYQRIQRLENLVGFNMLAGNIASVTTNFAPLFQALGSVRSTSMLQAIGAYAIGKVQHDVWRDGSDFLVNRKGYDPLYTNAMGKVKDAMFAPFNWVDDFVSEVIVRAKYIDELRNGASPEEAMRTADIFAGSVIADRTVGELPVLYNSKTFKVFTMFQVEVNNDLRFLLKDMPREARKNKKVTALVLFRSLLRYLLAVYTFNDLFEALFGRRVTFDPLNTLNDLAGVAFGKKLPNGFEVMAEWIRTKEAPDWDTLFDAEHSDKPLSELAAIGEDVAGDLPFVAGLFGGGRYPVFAFLPNRSQTQSGFAAWEDLLFTHENDTKYDWQQIYKMNRNALTYLQPIPFIPGGQVRRTAEGIMAASKEGSYNLTKKGEILQYPILTTYDKFKAAVFGKNTTKGGKEWVKSDFDSLSVEETEAYIDLVTAGSDGQKIYDVLRDLHGDDRDAVTKAYALASANLKDSERIRLLDVLVSEGQSEKFAAMMTDGDLTFRQCAEVYDKYHELSKMGELKDTNDDYVYKKAELATRFAAWIDDEGYTDEQKEAITEQYKFWNMVPAEANNYEKLTAAGVSRDNAVDLSNDWSELEPLPDEDEVMDFQKIAVVASAGYLSEKEKHYAIRSLLKDEKNKSGVSPQDKYTTYVMDYHIPAEVYSRYCTLSYGVTGDDLDGDGKNDAYTKCDKLFAIIDRLPLSNGQKTALAIYKGGVAESTVYKRAPWLH